MIVVYHNPDCGTSRNVLTILRAAGTSPVIVRYLEEGWTRPQLLGLFAAADVTARAALRISKSPAEAMGLTDPVVSDDDLIAAMVEHPILVNRPFVAAPKGVGLCRPSHLVAELMDRLPDGEVRDEWGEIIFPV